MEWEGNAFTYCSRFHLCSCRHDSCLCRHTAARGRYIGSCDTWTVPGRTLGSLVGRKKRSVWEQILARVFTDKVACFRRRCVLLERHGSHTELMTKLSGFPGSVSKFLVFQDVWAPCEGFSGQCWSELVSDKALSMSSQRTITCHRRASDPWNKKNQQG